MSSLAHGLLPFCLVLSPFLVQEARDLDWTQKPHLTQIIPEVLPEPVFGITQVYSPTLDVSPAQGKLSKLLA